MGIFGQVGAGYGGDDPAQIDGVDGFVFRVLVGV